jgi:hypothetical protein
MAAHHIVLAIFAALVMAAALAGAVYAPGSRRAFTRDKVRFSTGSARDPEKRLVGPHRTYVENALGFLVIVLPIALIGFYAYPPPI